VRTRKSGRIGFRVPVRDHHGILGRQRDKPHPRAQIWFSSSEVQVSGLGFRFSRFGRKDHVSVIGRATNHTHAHRPGFRVPGFRPRVSDFEFSGVECSHFEFSDFESSNFGRPFTRDCTRAYFKYWVVRCVQVTRRGWKVTSHVHKRSVLSYRFFYYDTNFTCFEMRICLASSGYRPWCR